MLDRLSLPGLASPARLSLPGLASPARLSLPGLASLARLSLPGLASPSRLSLLLLVLLATSGLAEDEDCPDYECPAKDGSFAVRDENL